MALWLSRLKVGDAASAEQLHVRSNDRKEKPATDELKPQRKDFKSPRDDGREFLFTGHRGSEHSMTTRQYARLVSEWIGSVGLDPKRFGTHSLRRTKATLTYRRTGNRRAVQLLLGHTKIESTVKYLGIEVDDALAIAEQVDI